MWTILNQQMVEKFWLYFQPEMIDFWGDDEGKGKGEGKFWYIESSNMRTNNKEDHYELVFADSNGKFDTGLLGKLCFLFRKPSTFFFFLII